MKRFDHEGSGKWEAASAEEAVEMILRENTRRLQEIGRKFDPVTGEGSTGERFLYESKASGRVRLPVSMQAPEVAKQMRKARSRDAFDRLRCLHDFPYWAATRAYIKNKAGGDDVLFVLNRPQRKFVERLEEMRLAGRPIRLILLKARQWGGSTCSQLYMAWLQLVHGKGLNSLIIAHQGVGSEEILDMFGRMIRAYPDRLLRPAGEKPPKGERKIEGVGKSRAMFRIPARNCKIKVGMFGSAPPPEDDDRLRIDGQRHRQLLPPRI